MIVEQLKELAMQLESKALSSRMEVPLPVRQVTAYASTLKVAVYSPDRKLSRNFDK
jgi:hypothetical protein